MRRNKVLEVLAKYQINEKSWAYNNVSHHLAIVNTKNGRTNIIKSIEKLIPFMKRNYLPIDSELNNTDKNQGFTIKSEVKKDE